MSAGAATLASPAKSPEAGTDRFLSFAFAAADLLVETDAAGVISFAAGAFRSRFGADAVQFLGRPITSLFCAADRAALDVALALVPDQGRIAPVVLALADRQRSEVSVAAFVRHGADAPPRISFSIGPLATQAVRAKPDAAGLQEPYRFGVMAQAALRDATAEGLGLIEVKGWDRVREALTTEDRRTLEASIDAALTEHAPDRTAGTLSDGRYGLLSPNPIDLDGAVARLEATLRSHPASAHAKVQGAQLTLEAGDIPRGQAARALRYALDRFAGGASAADAVGDGSGLAGILASAQRDTQALQATLNERRFRLLYQPVVNLSDRTIQHYEALLRPITMPNVTIKDTQGFVTFAEAVGLSEALDWAVMEMALEALHKSPNVAIAVNMSGLSMQNPEYRGRLLTRLADLRAHDGSLSANRLLIELTETAEIDDLQAAASSMEQLRSVGIPVCLDDFGAGASAFRYLRAFGVDYVKIDGSYVRAAATSKRDRQLVASMVDLAATGGAKVVAEMIETEAEASLMMELGVTHGQGWLFGKPGRLPGSL